MPGAKPYTMQHTVTHPLARMLPIQREQMQVYRLGEKHPPAAGLRGMGPVWEAVSFNIATQTTLQARVNVQRAFTLVALTASASSIANGGFRVQFYDTKKQLRFADRNVNFANFAGNLASSPGGAFFLREPWEFDQADSQIELVMQNFELVTNTIQVVFYGLVLRFNEPRPGHLDFPGGPVLSIGE
jgi:hypothetical protein